jgi:DNA invertase Pin-like site-specific DNA recombinase
MLNLIGSVAQFEREVVLERQREGIAKAKADGKWKGSYSARKATEVRLMAAEGDEGGHSGQAGVGVASVYRALMDGP